MEKPSAERPPIGVYPEKLWLWDRVQELNETRIRYVEVGTPTTRFDAELERRREDIKLIDHEPWPAGYTIQDHQKAWMPKDSPELVEFAENLKAKSPAVICDKHHIAYSDACPRCKPEPALSLLVIDLGTSCVVKVEKGRLSGSYLKDFKPALSIVNAIGDGFFGVGSGCLLIWETFNLVRSAIDALEGEKPVPRIEKQEGGFFHLISVNKTPVELWGGDYNALSELAGHPLPVWEPKKGEWVRLLGGISDAVNGKLADIQVWRYTR